MQNGGQQGCPISSGCMWTLLGGGSGWGGGGRGVDEAAPAAHVSWCLRKRSLQKIDCTHEWLGLMFSPRLS